MYPSEVFVVKSHFDLQPQAFALCQEGFEINFLLIFMDVKFVPIYFQTALVNEFSIDIWNYLNFSKITHFDSVIC
jgi:hypothetical protein